MAPSPIVAGVVHRSPAVLRVDPVDVQTFRHQLRGQVVKPEGCGVVKNAPARLV